MSNSIESPVVSAYGATLIDDADAATARATLGLGTTQLIVDTGNNRVGINKTPGLPFDVLGVSRFVQSGSGYNTGYALSVQSNSTQTYVEILNSGGTGHGAFLGINVANFEIWNYQGGNTLFFNGATPGVAAVTLTLASGGDVTVANALFSKTHTITSAASPYNGELLVGSEAAYRGRIYYNGATDGNLWLENSYVVGDIVFRTKTASTPVVTTIKADGKFGLAGITSPTAWLHLPAGTANEAQLCFTDGVEPTTKNDGDGWREGNEIHLYLGGTEYKINLTAV